jgi:gas vesicle protein
MPFHDGGYPMDTDDELEQDDGVRDEAGEGAGGTGFATGLIVGALLGASIALLFAPDRGDRTRRAVRKRLERLRDDAADGLERAGKVTRKDLLRRRQQLRAQVERALDHL